MPYDGMDGGGARQLSQETGRKLVMCSLFLAQGGLCYYCGVPMSLLLGLPITATLDHVVPRSHGGGAGDNLVGACYDCNQGKGSMSAAAWFAKVTAKNTALVTVAAVALTFMASNAFLITDFNIMGGQMGMDPRAYII